MIWEIATVLCLFAAGVPALLFLVNLLLYQAPPRFANRSGGEVNPRPQISVLIPARNEERCIVSALRSVLSNEAVDLEVLVLDDHSSDRTPVLVDSLAKEDPRVRRLIGPDLPPGWCGKQFACHELSRHARYPWLVFMDADVQLAPDALSRVIHWMEQRHVDLGSGVPLQKTETFLERLLIPLIHFVLLGFLPLRRMRRSTEVKFAAGCGQLFVARSSAYRSSGGHAAVRSSLHDGLQLPRAFRRHHFKTDLFDATTLARCRMYQTSAETWVGLSKNATEGLASPRLIAPVSLVLLLGQVVPTFLILLRPSGLEGVWWGMMCAAAIGAWVPRLLASWRFRQSWLSAFLHPLGVVLLLVIQWQAWLRARRGGPMVWKGRSYPAVSVRSASSESLPQSGAPLPGRVAN